MKQNITEVRICAAWWPERGEGDRETKTQRKRKRHPGKDTVTENTHQMIYFLPRTSQNNTIRLRINAQHMSPCIAHIQTIIHVHSRHIQDRKHACCHAKGSILVYYLTLDKYNCVFILEDVSNENGINQDKTSIQKL